ncbi:MAG TPA: hypothetical protein VMT18_14645 [Planctomycetota bacterium]|nr:hypothetical protein [Planctomycetota bacterium]
MGNGLKGTPGEGRPRVVWSRRGQRRWCPGAGRSSAAATANVPTGWTAYLHWQAVVDAVRGRRAMEPQEPQEPQEPETELATRALAADQPHAEPRAALPDRRRAAPSEEPALDGWLDATSD